MEVADGDRGTTGWSSWFRTVGGPIFPGDPLLKSLRFDGHQLWRATDSDAT